MSHLESNLPSLTGISGPPQSATASAPATTIKSAHDTVSTNSRKFDSCETPKLESIKKVQASKWHNLHTFMNVVNSFFCFSQYLFNYEPIKQTSTEGKIKTHQERGAPLWIYSAQYFQVCQLHKLQSHSCHLKGINISSLTKGKYVSLLNQYSSEVAILPSMHHK